MSGSDSKPKVVIPEVQVDWWMFKAEVSQCVVSQESPAKTKKFAAPIPDVQIRRLSKPGEDDPVNAVLTLVRFEALKDGVHLRFSTDVFWKNCPELHVVMKKPDMRKVTSAILATIAFRAEAPKLEDRWNLKNEWLRKMYVKLESLAESKGPAAFHGLEQQVVDAVLLCKKSFDKAAGRDVVDLKEVVRKAFEVLSDHMEEEDVVRMWRETVTSQVLGS